MIGITQVVARDATLDDLNSAGAADAHCGLVVAAFLLLGFDWLQALDLPPRSAVAGCALGIRPAPVSHSRSTGAALMPGATSPNESHSFVSTHSSIYTTTYNFRIYGIRITPSSQEERLSSSGKNAPSSKKTVMNAVSASDT